MALITGASAGLGAEFAKLFARDGHSLILVARRKERMQALAETLKESTPMPNCWIIEQDLSEAGAGAEVLRQVGKYKCDVDFLINNAGFGSNGRFDQLDAARELEMVDLNIRALVELTHLVLPGMVQRKSGKILNVGSVAGYQPGPFMATYYASKAFVNSFSEALHEELKGTGVSCTLLAPGFTATEFQDSAKLRKGGLITHKLAATAEQVAAQGYNAMMSGAAIKVPGGMNVLSTQSVRFVPRSLVRRLSARVNKSAT